MRIGLVTQPKTYTRRILIKRLFGTEVTDYISKEKNPFELSVQILPYSKRCLDKMSAKRLSRLVDKAISRLERYDVEKIVFSQELKLLFENKNIVHSSIDADKTRLYFLKLMPLCFRQTAKKCGINLLTSSVCISDTKMDRISAYLMRQLCFDVNDLAICTQNSERAQRLCDEFYDETGLLVQVCKEIKRNTDIVIDVDAASLRIGRDLRVCGADFGFDFSGYNVSHMDVALHLQELDYARIRWIYTYDKNA